jgi:DNA-directed RNA polymerase specialized sigma24 family protein
MNMLDDAAIIRLSLTEPEMFELLFQRHAPAIQRYVVRRLGVDASDDIV